MTKLSLIAILVLSMATVAEAARKSKNNPETHPVTSENCQYSYQGCDDVENTNEQSSNETHTNQSGTYEGNDRDTGSDYINGMPY